MSVHARGGFVYFITFIDDYSQYGYLYLMRYKSEAFEKFKEFKNEVEKQLWRSIKALRSNRGGEYLSQAFLDYLRDNGILSQWTLPYTPQYNGVAERRNRTLLDMSMMGKADLLNPFGVMYLRLLFISYTKSHPSQLKLLHMRYGLTKSPIFPT